MRHFNLILLVLCSSCAFVSCSDGNSIDEKNIVYQCDEKEYVPFRYVDFNTVGTAGSAPYLMLGGPVLAQDIERVVFVLEFYGIPYRMGESGVEILCATWSDKDMMANLGKKARSKPWLELQRYTGALEDLNE